MKVSTRVHYGLRAMTELARCYHQDRLLSIAEIARNEDLPLAYLEQLVGELRRASLVEGTRGVRGGYRLVRPPSEITVGEVYQVLEGEVAPVDCTSNEYLAGSCSRDCGCLSRSVWDRVQQAILAVLNATTLQDLVEGEAQGAVHSTGASFVPLSSVHSPSGGSPSTPAGTLTHA